MILVSCFGCGSEMAVILPSAAVCPMCGSRCFLWDDHQSKFIPRPKPFDQIRADQAKMRAAKAAAA